MIAIDVPGLTASALTPWGAGGPGDAPPAELRETHISVLVMLGGMVLKVKKPVHLSFIDLSTLEQRRIACEREVEFNRRLAPDVYLGVAELRGPDGEVWEHAVAMRRLPDDRRLATLLSAGVDVRPELRAIAAAVARLHAQSEPTPQGDATATPAAVLARWDDGFSTLRRALNPSDGSVDRLERLVRAYLAGREPAFRTRIDTGRIRDGHGDLLTEDIFCLPDGPRILDCLEFADDLRVGDVLADVAFLAMDLERLGRPELAQVWLDEYRDLTADVWPASLEHHYLAYRAQVRAKVRALVAAQGNVRAGAEAWEMLRLAIAHAEAARVRLVLVGGLPGRGKSTLAAGLERMGLGVTLSSDVVRKELAGLSPRTPAGAPLDEGLYGRTWTERTYAELLDRAEALLGAGTSVVLDASWASAAWRRRAAAVARRTTSELVELRCTCPTAVAEQRILDRRPGDTSDATVSVARALAARAEPWPTATVLDTTEPAGEVADRAWRAAQRATPPSVDGGGA
ncbi:MAG TPA: AAA family ATPase [Acidimicrobiales bacterium]|nr:AAA family ATPase [Acidimicrobiales bacterium]